MIALSHFMKMGKNLKMLTLKVNTGVNKATRCTVN